MYEVRKVQKKKNKKKNHPLLLCFLFQVNHRGHILFSKQVLSSELKNYVFSICLFLLP